MDLTEKFQRLSQLSYNGSFQEAHELCLSLSQEDPKNMMLRFCLARLKMALGDWHSSLELFDSVRGYDIFGGPYVTQQKPLWTGTVPLSGKRVLLSSEGGLGDIVCFSRFCKNLQDRGAHVLLAVDREMFPLLKTLPCDVQLITPDAVDKVDFDLWLPALSAPRLLQLSPEDLEGRPFLHGAPTDHEKWRKLCESSKPTIGLFWQGNPQFAEDQYRSLRAKELTPLLEQTDFQFLSVQCNHPSNPFSDSRLKDLSAHILSPLDLAGYLLNLDLVISVDTGPAHLAAALGVPTLLLNRTFGWFTFAYNYTPGLQSTPWYKSMTLLNQKEFNSWNHEIELLQKQLPILIKNKTDLRVNPALPHPQSPSPSLETVTTVSTRNGKWVVCPNDFFVGKALELYGEYSQHEVDFLTTKIRRGDTVIDGGAHFGYMSGVFAQLVGPQGCVHSFEPQPFLRKILELNACLRNFSWIETHDCALGESPKASSLPSPDYDVVGNYGALEVGETVGSLQIQVRRLDDFRFEKIDLIKLDVEGSEYAALKGAEQTIRKHRPFLWIEMDRQHQVDAIVRLLSDWGYSYEKKLFPLYNENNFRAQKENIFGAAMTCNYFFKPQP